MILYPSFIIIVFHEKMMMNNDKKIRIENNRKKMKIKKLAD